MPDKVKCCEKLFADFHYYPCSRNATTEHEGKPYCKTHNPALRKAKQDASYQAWKDENAAKRDKEKSDKHKIAVHDALVAALENLLKVHEGEGGTKFHAGNIARTALALAKKD